MNPILSNKYIVLVALSYCHHVFPTHRSLYKHKSTWLIANLSLVCNSYVAIVTSQYHIVR